MTDRNDWIQVRAADGYDWTPLVVALSKLVYLGYEACRVCRKLSRVKRERGGGR